MQTQPTRVARRTPPPILSGTARDGARVRDLFAPPPPLCAFCRASDATNGLLLCDSCRHDAD